MRLPSVFEASVFEVSAREGARRLTALRRPKRYFRRGHAQPFFANDATTPTLKLGSADVTWDEAVP